MPTTKTVDCDERMLAEAWLKHENMSVTARYQRVMVKYIAGRLGRNRCRLSSEEHADELLNALWLKLLRSKYEGAFSRLLSTPRCRARKPRTVVLSPQNAALKKLMDSWMHEDVEEQADTWKRLKTTLEENRSSSRNLFS
jgi:hypothetical protein